MIENRPAYLDENLKFYKKFPVGVDLDADYGRLPQLLNLDFHTLNGILPLTKSRFNFLGNNSKIDDKEATVIFVNPSKEEYEYYKSIGVTEFQAIQIVMNFFAFEENPDGSLSGLPYSISLVPMEKNKKIDTWNINLLMQCDLEELCQKGGGIYTEFNPFQGWYNGLAMDYDLFSRTELGGYTDSIAFIWGMYFLSPIFNKHEVRIPENYTLSKAINSKYRKYKTGLYFKSFANTKPRRIWGCDSPIELFLLQGLYTRGLKPDIQTCFFRNGITSPNYYKMHEDGIWIGQDNLITSADLFFPEYKTAIFCDGSNFHNKEKDQKIDLALSDLGIKSLRYSGKQITENLENVLDDIEKELKA